jgi:4-diphosphocytidyl-2-C-methyl-D-erythritol kinase
MESALGLPAPAKLNLFLHVTGRRADGYHTLQTAFQLIDLADWVEVGLRGDGQIVRDGDLRWNAGDDLPVRAALALRKATGCRLGASIRVTKNIPAGSGMGGGSSDAATTLIALNRVWGLGLTRTDLAAIALPLGADVPFFLLGGNAFAEGVGEELRTIVTPPAWYAVIWPQVHVSTREIFADPGLTRNTKPTKIADFSVAVGLLPQTLLGANDLEPVARRRFPEIEQALAHLRRHGPARMTGSGSAVFAPMASSDEARNAVTECVPRWQCWAVRGLSEHPLAAW